MAVYTPYCTVLSTLQLQWPTVPRYGAREDDELTGPNRTFATKGKALPTPYSLLMYESTLDVVVKSHPNRRDIAGASDVLIGGKDYRFTVLDWRWHALYHHGYQFRLTDGPGINRFSACFEEYWL